MVDQIIRPSALPRRSNPVASEIAPVDNGVQVAGSTLAEIVNAGRPVASRPEAEAGVNAEKSMSPLTTKQSIASEVGVTLASKAQGDKADSAIQEIVEGANTTVDNTDPQRPIISSSGSPSVGFKSDIVVIDGQTNWRVARNYKTVSAMLADDGSGGMGMGYAGSGANVIVSPGDIVTAQGFRYEVLAGVATDFDRQTAGGVKLRVPSDISEAFIEMFGDLSDDEAVLRAMRTKKLKSIKGDQRTLVLYVDPVIGDNDYIGTKTQPIRTVQEAVDRIPKRVSDLLLILDLSTVANEASRLPNAYDEDVWVQGVGSPIIGTVPQIQGVLIRGDANKENVSLGSMIISECYGLVTPSIEDMVFTRQAPYPADTNEDTAVQVVNCSEVSIRRVGFRPELGGHIRGGITAYNSHLDTRGIDVSNLDWFVIHSKRKSKTSARDYIGTFSPTPDAASSYVGGGPFAATEMGELYYLGADFSHGANSAGITGSRPRYGARIQWTGNTTTASTWEKSDLVDSFGKITIYDLPNETVINKGAYEYVPFSRMVMDDSPGRFFSPYYVFLSNLDTKSLYKIRGVLYLSANDLSVSDAVDLRIITPASVQIENNSSRVATSGGGGFVTYEVEGVVRLSQIISDYRVGIQIRVSGTGASYRVSAGSKFILERL